MGEIIPYGKHYIDDQDIKAVVNVLKNKNLTQGEEVGLFETAIAKYVGAKYAVAFSSWTSGLHLANIILGIKKGDEVITSPITFAASANSILFCNGVPVFSDIDKETANICSIELRKTILKNTRVKALIPVHFSGLPCDMVSISKLAKEFDLEIIEDAAHALGAKYPDGSMVGNCKYSLMTGFSFHPVKSIATGEGGMITTNNYDIYKRLIRLRSHGINKLDDKFLIPEQSLTDGVKNLWYYEMQELGYNYRITDFQCALGKSQLSKLNKFIDRRKILVAQYDNAFENSKNINPIQLNSRNQSSHHLYVVRIDFKASKITRAKLMTLLSNEGIYTQVHYMPLTLHPYYKKLKYNSNNLTNALSYYDECLSLPLYYSLSDVDQKKVIKTIKKYIS